MSTTKTSAWYEKINRPKWAPPSWLFGPVWTILYLIILISYGYLGYLFFIQKISFLIVLPFILNLIFNLIYSPIQFGSKNYVLASIDILLILATIVWELIVVFPYVSWISYVNIPYLLWVSFATVLQLTITFNN